jgi:hypothetical protein
MQRSAIKSDPAKAAAWRLRSAIKAAAKPRQAMKRGTTRIKPITKKTAKRNRDYNKLAAIFLMEHPTCACCGGRSEQVHHKAGRGVEVFWKFWMAVCRFCHEWIESNRELAYARGWLLSRHNPGEDTGGNIE